MSTQPQIHFTSDCHFGHKNIMTYCPPRGERWKSLEEMDEGLIERWNSVVGPNDIVYNLGDFFFSKEARVLSILDRLNGKIRFIYGNHDKVIKESTRVREHHRFEWLKDYEETSFHGVVKKVCLFHFPIASWHAAHRMAWHLHGHTHGSFPPLGHRVDVGIDSPFITGKPEHRPFSMDEIARYMAKQKFEPVDHHM